jgi:hypothetical protein
MATTFLEAINRVLEKIGEDTIPAAATSLTETYEILVGSFVNDIKEEIEDAHNWRALRQTVSTVIAGDAQSATITEANERSRVVRIYQQNRGGVVPLVFDVTDSNNPDPLVEMDLAELIYRDTVDPDVRQDPQYFALDNSSGDVLDLYVWPRPSASTTIQSTLIIPQARFDNADVAESLKIPIRPLIVGATWYALEERGEELGTGGVFNEQRYRDALNAAISRDDAEQGNVSELVRV